MWKASRVSAETANGIQVNAGTLLKTYDISNPVPPKDEDIVTATTGDFSITCQPETEDFFEDVNNVPNNTMEGKRITGWNCQITVNAIEATEDVLLLALGAAGKGSDGGIHPRSQYELTDFKSLYWIGDMVDNDKLLVVAMDHTVSTGGVSLTTTKNGKGQIALELTPHASISNQEKVPMAFYVLTKVDSYAVGFNSNGGTKVSSQIVSNGGKLTEPSEPTKTGFDFDGWYKDTALSTEWNFETDTVTSDGVLHAKWTET